jgi:hypothetical protein
VKPILSLIYFIYAESKNDVLWIKNRVFTEIFKILKFEFLTYQTIENFKKKIESNFKILSKIYSLADQKRVSNQNFSAIALNFPKKNQNFAVKIHSKYAKTVFLMFDAYFIETLE